MERIILQPIQISKSDIDKLILPEGYELRRVKTKAERIAELQVEKDNILQSNPPDDKELIELGRKIHPYYMELERIDDELKELS